MVVRACPVLCWRESIETNVRAKNARGKKGRVRTCNRAITVQYVETLPYDNSFICQEIRARYELGVQLTWITTVVSYTRTRTWPIGFGFWTFRPSGLGNTPG
jgi:hypothetical protein